MILKMILRVDNVKRISKRKGKKCMTLKIGNDKYCCVYSLRKKGKHVKVVTPIFGGTIGVGSRCRHHNSLTRFAFFCKKHPCDVVKNMSSNSNLHFLKRKAEESFNGSKNHICNDLALVHLESRLDIDTVTIIDGADYFSAKTIIGIIREHQL